MSDPQPFTQPQYGNWVPTRILGITAALFLVFAVLAFWVSWVAGLLSAVFLAALLYFAYAWWRFSPRGGNLQQKIRGLVLDHLAWDGQGRALDIGCGNGPLTMALARKYPQATVLGTDFWGPNWDYSQKACQDNAAAEGVAHRVEFQKASAAALPFGDESFDAAVSNMVFHEVRDAKDKREVIREALRVVKKGGAFAFQDLLLWNKLYGEPDDLVNFVKSLGVERVEFTATRDLPLIPRALKLPFMLGAMGLLHGRK